MLFVTTRHQYFSTLYSPFSPFGLCYQTCVFKIPLKVKRPPARPKSISKQCCICIYRATVHPQGSLHAYKSNTTSLRVWKYFTWPDWEGIAFKKMNVSTFDLDHKQCRDFQWKPETWVSHPDVDDWLPTWLPMGHAGNHYPPAIINGLFSIADCL